MTIEAIIEDIGRLMHKNPTDRAGSARRRKASWLITMSLCTAASAASAQVDVPPMDMTGAMLNREAMRVQLGAVLDDAGGRHRSTGSAQHGHVSAVPPRPLGSAAPIRTSYRSDPAVTARVRQQFFEFVRRSAGPAGADAVRSAFTRTDPLQSWGRSAAGDGMRLGDVGDALTEYWVQNWTMANGLTEAPPAKVRAVRAQMQGVLAHSPAIVRLTDAGRQELAEVYIYNALLQGDVYGSAVKTRDHGLMARLGDAAEARMRNELGLDARHLALTDAGFVARG